MLSIWVAVAQSTPRTLLGRAMVFGPPEIEIVTVAPDDALVPAAGTWLTTDPAGTLGDGTGPVMAVSYTHLTLPTILRV